MTRNSNLFVLSDFLEPDGMQRDLQDLCSRTASVNAIQTLDASEVRVPARGSLELQDVESGTRRPTMMTDSTERDAVATLHAHNESLQRFCRSMNIRLTACDTDQQWQKILLRHLQLRS